jgi:hypothetical protein
MTFYVSRNAKVNQIHSQICEKLSLSDKKDKLMSGHMLKNLSRLWRFGPSDDFDSVREALSGVGQDYN